ncbi:hypothetical protein [Kyrpidia tusciae]|nr:hypothetical protein [Kyrpidia tusciae]
MPRGKRLSPAEPGDPLAGGFPVCPAAVGATVSGVVAESGAAAGPAS